MPIYAYRCSSCGHAQDVLQKLSDPLLTTCPACGAQTFTKQVTAAGFQLKGSGWYVTDFRGGANGGAKKDGEDAAKASDKPGDKPSDKAAGGGEAKPDTKPAEAAAPASPASPPPAASAPAGNS